MGATLSLTAPYNRRANAAHRFLKALFRINAQASMGQASWPMLVQTEIEAGDLVLWPKEAVQRSDMLERYYQVMSSDPVKELATLPVGA